jgi:hypothetical protein
VSRRAVASRSLPALLLAAAVGVCLWALPALSFVPKAERIANAAAKANEAASRTQALQLDLTLRVAERDPIGTGTLVTHPTGLARLELRDAAEREERHLLLGAEHSASRNGEELRRPRAFLPPLFLLQADSPETLRQALSDYGLDVEAVALAPCGQRVCYLLGDPTQVAPPMPTKEELAKLAEQGELPEPPPPRPERDESEPPPPAVWIDAQSFEIVKMQSQTGVAVELGPFVAFDAVRFPESITIQEPGREPVHLDIRKVTPVNAPAADFRRAWLLTPPGSGEAGNAAAPRRTSP